MRVTYKLFDSLAKTIKQNNLYRAERNKKIMLDLSLVDGMDLAEEEKERLKAHCIKHMNSATSDFDFYSYEPYYFKLISLKLYYKRISVISSDGCKIAYHVMRLCKIDGASMARTDVWSNYVAVKVYDIRNEDNNMWEEIQIVA